MHIDHHAFLRAQCNQLTHGECRSLNCLLRGGYVRGTPCDSEIATCEALEIHKLLLQEPAAPAQSLTITDVKARIGAISTRTISRLIKRGLLKRVPGVRRVLVTEESLAQYLSV